MDMDQRFIKVSPDRIIPNSFQPRTVFNENKIEELADSIKVHGLLQPLIVRKAGDKFEIIAGERRYRAAIKAGLHEIPVIVQDMSDQKIAEFALVENVQREKLSPIEEARAYKQVLDLGEFTQDQLSQKIGISQEAISAKINLLSLTENAQQALLQNKISERHARSLLKLSDKKMQDQLLNEIIMNRLTVKDTDARIAEIIQNTEYDKKENINSNTISLNDLNNNNFIEEKKELNNMNDNLNNNQNFNQQPTQSENKFFPSLEDEVVNMNFINEQTQTNENIQPNSIPQFEQQQNEIVQPSVQEAPTFAMPNEQVQASPIPEFGPQPENEMVQPSVQEAPTFAMPNEQVQASPIPQFEQQQNEIVQPSVQGAPTFVMPNEQVQASSIPEFGPQPVNEMVQPSVQGAPTFAMPNEQVQASPIPEFGPQPVNEMVQPSVQGAPTFAMPNEQMQASPIPEFGPQPINEIVQPSVQMSNNQQQLFTAINTIRPVVNSLKDQGFPIEVQELDLATDYQIIIKIGKQ